MYYVKLPDGFSVINKNGTIEVWKNYILDDIRNNRYCGDRVVLFLIQKIEELELQLKENNNGTNRI
jgi:hypothetical protein